MLRSTPLGFGDTQFRRTLALFAFCALAGCETAQEPIAQKLAYQHQGRNIDQIVLTHGPPTTTFAMSNGDKMFEWQMPAGTDGNGNTVQCKIRAVANPHGIVQNITTNDQNTGSGSTWCAHALEGNLANVQNDNAAAEAAVDAAVGTALLGAILF